MATIYDVARRARVSTATVSAVLNGTAYVSPELTRRVRKAVDELDYTINDLARSLQTRRTRTIGMLIPDIAGPFYAKVVRGAEDVLRREGYSLILGNTYNDVDEQSRYLSVFRSKQVDGLLLFVAAGDESEVRRLVEKKRPVVFVGRTPHGFQADSVTADNVKGARLATEYLLEKGHRHVAIITGHLSLSTSSDRVTGYRQAFRKRKLPVREDCIAEGDWTAESGWRETLRLMDLEEPPTAIFVSNFLMTTGLLRALRSRGIECPGQVEVVSSDDSEWYDAFSPAITTVVQPSYEMGELAAELLLLRIRDPRREFERIVLAPELKIRAEAAPVLTGSPGSRAPGA